MSKELDKNKKKIAVGAAGLLIGGTAVAVARTQDGAQQQDDLVLGEVDKELEKNQDSEKAEVSKDKEVADSKYSKNPDGNSYDIHMQSGYNPETDYPTTSGGSSGSDGSGTVHVKPVNPNGNQGGSQGQNQGNGNASEEKVVYHMVSVLNFEGTEIRSIAVKDGEKVDLSSIKETELALPENLEFVKWDKDITSINSDITIKPVTQVKTFSVKFLDHERNVILEETVEYGSDLKAPEAPILKGYTFTGWSAEAKDIKEDLVISAKYEINQYDVEVKDQDGEVIASLELDYGTTAKDIKDMIPLEEGQYIASDDIDFEELEEDTVINVELKLKELTVQFKDDNGLIEETTYKYGEKIPPSILSPEKEGHDFVGWDKDLPKTATPVENKETLVLTAQFEIHTFDVVYQVDGKEVHKETVDWSSDAKGFTPKELPEGKHFIAWDQEAKDVREDLVLNAELGVNELEIVIMDGEDVLHEETLKYNDKVTQFVAPEKEGHDFVGFDVELPEIAKPQEKHEKLVINTKYEIHKFNVDYRVDGKVIFTEVVEWSSDAKGIEAPEVPAGKHFIEWNKEAKNVREDVVIDAVLGDNIMVIEFKDGEDVIDTKEYKYGDKIEMPEAPEKEGHDFIEWIGLEDTVAKPNDKEVKLTVHAKYDIQRFNVKYMLDGKLVHTDRVDWNTNSKAPDASSLDIPEGYHFVKWDKEANNVKEDMVVEAEIAINVYKVEVQDTKGGTISLHDVEHGSSIELPENKEEVEGYHFVKWSHDGQNIKGDTVISPVFEINVYTVDFLDEDGKLIESVKVEHGSDAKEPKAPEKTGWDFLRWSEDVHNVKGDMEVTVVYGRQVKKVTFVDHNGETVRTARVEYGLGLEKDDIPEAPRRIGYSFVKWDANLDKVTDHMTVKPIYEVKTFDVTFKTDQGDLIETVPVQEGTLPKAPKLPEITGYHFVGWDKDFEDVMGEQEYVAKYEINKYDVTVLDAEGNVLEVMKVEHGKDLDEVTPPEIEGYHFVKWNGSFENITEDRVIQAEYEINKYDVSVLDKEGELIEVIKVEHGQGINDLVAPEVEGYHFVDWEVSDDVDLDNITQDITVKAHYEINVYLVQFTFDGEVVHEEHVPHGSDATAPQDPEMVGRKFLGWRYDWTNITDHTHIPADWEYEYYNVVFMDHGKAIFRNVRYGLAAEAPTPIGREGYHFVGWSEDTSFVEGEMTVYAKYEINKYDVTVLDMNGKELAKTIVEHGQDLDEITPPEVEGYHFVRWDGSFENITEDITIQAVYEINKYDVDFVMGDEVVTKVVEHGSSVEYPEPIEIEGYDFVRWNKKVDKVTSDITIEAIYEIKTYEVVFQDENGQDFDKVIVEHGSEAKTDKIPEKTGYDFVGWDIDLSSVTEDGLIAKPKYEVQMLDLSIAKRFLGYASSDLDKQELAEKMQDPSMLEDIVIEVPYGSNVSFERSLRGFTGNVIVESEHLDGGREVHKIREYEYFNDPAYNDQYFFYNVTEDIDSKVTYIATSFRYNLVDEDGNVLREERGYIGNKVDLENYSIKKDIEREGYDVVGMSENGNFLTGPEDVVVKYKPIVMEIHYYDKDGKVFAKGERLYTQAFSPDDQDPVEYKSHDFIRWEVKDDMVNRITHVTPKYEIKKFDLKFFYKDPYTGKKEYFKAEGVPNARVPFGTDLSSYEDHIAKSANYIGFNANVNLDQLRSIESDADIEVTYTVKDTALAVDVNVEGTMQTYYVEVVNNSPEDVLRYANEHRRANGVSEMRLRDEFLEAAIQRATEASVKFSHLRPFKDESGNYADGSTVIKDVHGINMDHMINENLGTANKGNSKEAVESWKASSGHNKTMLDGDYKSMISVGINIDRRAPHVMGGPDFWVQLFFMD